MSASHLLAKSVSLITSVFLQACTVDKEPVQIIDKTTETLPLARAKAERENAAALIELEARRKESIDGNGQVFFKGGIGIVYTSPLQMQESRVGIHRECTRYHHDAFGTRSKLHGCQTEKITAEANFAAIIAPSKAQYINGPKALVCSDKFSALTSLAYDAPPQCQAFAPNTVPEKTYDLLRPHVIGSKGTKITQATVFWANLMPN